jgi:3-deoxy-D-arabino-heptulosonate 7-phosphate (DAHP) synthase
MNPLAAPTSVATAPTSNLRIRSLESLVPPSRLCALLPLDDAARATIVAGRHAVEQVLAGVD